MEDAIRGYRWAIHLAERDDEPEIVAEALRRLSVIHHMRGEIAAAREEGARSLEIAQAQGNGRLAASALNTLASYDLERGDHESAEASFRRALWLAAGDPRISAQIEQNLGILANIRGRIEDALEHYGRSLTGFRKAGDPRGCAIAYHNLGMISSDRGRWDDADRYYRRTLALASELGDVYLQGLALLNRAEVHITRCRFTHARDCVTKALEIFRQTRDTAGQAAANRFLGVIYRETQAIVLAEARLNLAIDLSRRADSPLEEAESLRELALVYRSLGRNRDALTSLNASHRLFHELQASLDQSDVLTRVGRLEDTFLAIVRSWGESIESKDAYTHGHCSRVASYAETVTEALRLEVGARTAIQVGAYLHDLGKVRVPAEILNKDGRLTNDEFDVVRMHPIWGVELLEPTEFPWDIKPIIRWHHERFGGGGYPDQLSGDDIPVAAQIICIVDVFDALTTQRSYRAAMTRDAALDVIRRDRGWWRYDVFDAFMTAIRTSAIG
ncbi:MAG: HD domain-containing phosphohydrolase [Gemmatimonadota bacterium]